MTLRRQHNGTVGPQTKLRLLLHRESVSPAVRPCLWAFTHVELLFKYFSLHQAVAVKMRLQHVAWRKEQVSGKV